ncbi:MAG: ABC transporter ATP-binding protein [Mycobacterium sp.]
MSRHETPLRAVDLDLGYRAECVVHGATLDLTAGEVTALVGPNGSGKSTLLRAMARLHHPESGDVRLADDSSALALSPREFARHVTLLAQSRPTPTGVRVREVVGYGRHPHRARWRGADPDGAEAIAWALEVTGVTEMADRPVDELSGGERQRVWLATALAQRTHTLLLDEPTTFLDIAHQLEVHELVRQLKWEHKLTVVLVLHDLNAAARFAHRIVALRNGKIVADGPPAEVVCPRVVAEVFGVQATVLTDPATGTPVCLPATVLPAAGGPGPG